VDETGLKESLVAVFRGFFCLLRK